MLGWMPGEYLFVAREGGTTMRNTGPDRGIGFVLAELVHAGVITPFSERDAAVLRPFSRRALAPAAAPVFPPLRLA